MPGALARRRDRCCANPLRSQALWTPWEVANETVASWRSWAPALDEVKASVKTIVINLQSLSGYDSKQTDPELSGELEPECDDPCMEAPRVRCLLHSAGVPRPLSTKIEELVATLSVGHVLFPSLGNLISGYETGMMSLAVMQLTSPFLIGPGWNALGAWDVGIIISSKFYGSFCGSLVAFDQCADISSRDILILSSCGVMAVSIASAFAPSFKYLIIARFLGGFLEGLSSPARIAYTTEATDANLRFAAMGVRTGTFGAGAVLGALLGGALLPVPGGWHVMLGASMVPALAMCAGMNSLPHSPRWLLGRTGSATLVERRAQALDALTELRADSRPARMSQADFSAQVYSELEAMLSIEYESTPKETEDTLAMLNNFMSNPATWTTFWVIFFKQTSGSVAMFYYKANVLTAVGLGSHVGLLTALMMFVKAVATPGGALLAGHLGYRNSLLLGSLGTSTSMMALSVCQASSAISPLGSSTLALALLVVNAVSFEISFGTVSHQLAAELYPQQLRQRGLAWTHLWNYPLKAGLLQLFPWVLAHAGPGPTWMSLALINTAGFVTMHQLVPETRGKRLEDIEVETTRRLQLQQDLSEEPC